MEQTLISKRLDLNKVEFEGRRIRVYVEKKVVKEKRQNKTTTLVETEKE